LLTWIFTGLLTISAALSYGELAALFRAPGGQYIIARSLFAALGFSTAGRCSCDSDGHHRSRGGRFCEILGVLFPPSRRNLVVPPIALSSKFAISLSVQQLVAVVMIIFLTFLNRSGPAWAS